MGQRLDYLAREITAHWSQHYKDQYPLDEVAPLIAWPDNVTVIFCTTTFNRNFQIKKALPLNVRLTWPYPNIFHAVVDFNEGEVPPQVPTFLESVLYEAVKRGHICYGHARLPDGIFHCPLAKNTAHAFGAVIAEQNSIPKENVYLINLDNDNVLTPEFLRSACQIAQEQLHSADPGPGQRRSICCQWKNKEPGLTGRIGMPLTQWLAFGGYDEDLTGMGLLVGFCAFFSLPPCPVDDPSF